MKEEHFWGLVLLLLAGFVLMFTAMWLTSERLVELGDRLDNLDADVMETVVATYRTQICTCGEPAP